MKDRFMKNDVFSLEYDKETLRDMILELQEENKKHKEFINYLERTIEELECDDVDDEEIKGYLIQRIDTFKEILLKYKEIIGGK